MQKKIQNFSQPKIFLNHNKLSFVINRNSAYRKFQFYLKINCFFLFVFFSSNIPQMNPCCKWRVVSSPPFWGLQVAAVKSAPRNLCVVILPATKIHFSRNLQYWKKAFTANISWQSFPVFLLCNAFQLLFDIIFGSNLILIQRV